MLVKKFKIFLDEHLDSSKPILLAYSGGSDSSCLLNLLLKVKNEYKIDLHIAHIDHSWRRNSAFEASLIKDRMKKLNIAFHLKKLKFTSKKNLENEARDQRLNFFKVLNKKHSFQAIIFAHHKDDLAETVLKRFLEGANIFSLTSMKKVSTFDDLTIFRPLLDVNKDEILSFLKQNNISYFEDPTNSDTKFLRAKMRKDIFPYLQENFNKQIKDNLAVLSSYSNELNEYLETKLSPILQKISHNSIGLYIDLNDIDQILELRFILKKIAIFQKIDFSRNILEKIIKALIQKKANFKIFIKNANIFVDRGYLFIINKELKLLKNKALIKQNLFDFGPWQIKISKVKKAKTNSSFKDLFSDKLSLYLPEDKYYISNICPDKKVKKLFENYKVPAVLRAFCPVIYSQNNKVYEFLSGKKMQLNNKNILEIEIKLK
ncbi:MAG: tRNA(Ile)-lysidine synthase [Candidatus Anoxychlamydiales bacterium]|nr:tRNA(Ile)-lysidine synthase [Candidatus Anoxychlamydiales bacterium]